MAYSAGIFGILFECYTRLACSTDIFDWHTQPAYSTGIFTYYANRMVKTIPIEWGEH